MKVLTISTFDTLGGAAKAAYRLHLSLLENGVESIMLVQNKNSTNNKVLGPDSRIEKIFNLFKPTLDQLPLIKYKSREKALFSTSWLNTRSIVKKINKMNPDIVHLHWVSFGMLDMKSISKINAPIVWSLHDCWAFTGGCHYFGKCEKYKISCGTCPNLLSKKQKDLSHRIFKKKLKNYHSHKNISIVGLSKWMQNSAKESCLFKDRNVINLPNPIKSKNYKPINKKYCRDLWNLPHDKMLILFGALNPTSDIRKGFIELVESLNLIKEPNIELVVFGSSESTTFNKFTFKTNYIGELQDDQSLVSLYNACDVTVVPSLQENLSNVIMESLSCGIPVVAFNVGGNIDMIDHKQNGYVAKAFDSQDFAHGIEWILKSSDYDSLSQNAREKVLKEFDEKIVVEKYISLYKSILTTN